MLDQFKLDGKIALVTGCYQGIGQAIAIGLAQGGADIVGVDMSFTGTDKDTESETALAVKKAGKNFKAYPCDFSDRKQLYEFITKVKADHPRIDILINNAGTIKRKPAVEHSDDYWDFVISVNLTAQFILSREFGKDMVARGSGKIVFTASLLSFQGGITVPGYAASKSGVARLAMALANEWASKGVNVNAIAPGYIATANTAALRADPERSKAILDRIPAGRWGTPEDLVGAVVFLSSGAADYVNGVTLIVDGGWMGR
ncbi:SDR family oxidoreductase [Candidatus Sumerlaeota bacterium]|nr:SDR family oxidoreductase [Candidatus Sumerlaeota bacterium]